MSKAEEKALAEFTKEATKHGYTVGYVRELLQKLPTHGIGAEHRLRATYSAWLQAEERRYANLCKELEALAKPYEVIAWRLTSFKCEGVKQRMRRWVKDRRSQKYEAYEVKDLLEQYEKEMRVASAAEGRCKRLQACVAVTKRMLKAVEVLATTYPSWKDMTDFKESLSSRLAEFEKDHAMAEKEDAHEYAANVFKFATEDFKKADAAFLKAANEMQQAHELLMAASAALGE